MATKNAATLMFPRLGAAEKRKLCFPSFTFRQPCLGCLLVSAGGHWPPSGQPLWPGREETTTDPVWNQALTYKT